MTNNPRSGPQVPQERPDPEAAARPSEGGDRPGFDLGGASEEATGVGSSVIPGGPKGSPASGSDAGGRDTGYTDPSGSHSLGGDGNAGPGPGSGPTNSSGRG